ncbi:unnamed protein product [Lota lota]
MRVRSIRERAHLAEPTDGIPDETETGVAAEDDATEEESRRAESECEATLLHERRSNGDSVYGEVKGQRRVPSVNSRQQQQQRKQQQRCWIAPASGCGGNASRQMGLVLAGQRQLGKF